MWKISLILISYYLIGIDADSMRIELKNLTAVKGVIACTEDNLQLCEKITDAIITDICGKEFSYTDNKTKATIKATWKPFDEIKCAKGKYCGTKIETSNSTLFASFACTNLKGMNDVITCGCSYMDDTKKSLAPPGNSPSSEISQGTDEVGDPTLARQEIKNAPTIVGAITCTKDNLGLCTKLDQTLLTEMCGKQYTYTDNSTKKTVTAPWSAYSKPICMQGKYCGAGITTNNKSLYATLVCLNTKDTAVACGCRLYDLSRKTDKDEGQPPTNPIKKRETSLEFGNITGMITCTEADIGPVCTKVDKALFLKICGPVYTYTDKTTTNKVEAPWTEFGKTKCVKNKFCILTVKTAKPAQYGQTACLNTKKYGEKVRCFCKIKDETPPT